MKTDVFVNGRLALRDVQVAGSFMARLRGLMFRPTIVPLLFAFDSEAVHDIHSFFVFGRFDALYLNEKMETVEIFSKVPLFSYVHSTRPSRYLLEAPAGFVEKHGLAVADKFFLRPPLQKNWQPEQP